jgi:hypothetical protein
MLPRPTQTKPQQGVLQCPLSYAGNSPRDVLDTPPRRSIATACNAQPRVTPHTAHPGLDDCTVHNGMAVAPSTRHSMCTRTGSTPAVQVSQQKLWAECKREAEHRDGNGGCPTCAAQRGIAISRRTTAENGNRVFPLVPE